MIVVEDVDLSYGDLQVLWDVSMRVEPDDRIVALIGPNGAGKTSLMRALSGLHPIDDGRIELFGTDVAGLSAADVVDLGFVQVPEGRNLFTEMTVAENLEMGAYTKRDRVRETMAEVFELFPALEERRNQIAGTLSGGEQQMLAIGRGLMTRPRILALDELSIGLAPQLADRVFRKVEEISDDVTVLLIEQHVDRALSLADRAYLLENGRITASGTGEDLRTSEHVRGAYL